MRRWVICCALVFLMGVIRGLSQERAPGFKWRRNRPSARQLAGPPRFYSYPRIPERSVLPGAPVSLSLLALRVEFQPDDDIQKLSEQLESFYKTDEETEES